MIQGELRRRLEAPDVPAVEALLGRALPAELVAFHRHDPRRFLVDRAVGTFDVAWFLPLDPQTLSECGGRRELLPLANDGCGNPYCVDMSHPTLRVLFFDEGEPEPFEVSASFRDFVDALTEQRE